MKVIWSKRAVHDLNNIVSYIQRDKPDAASRVATRIFDEVMALVSMPNRGRPGLASGSREIIFHPWPYIAVYRVVEDEVRIVRIRHAAQNWP